MMRTSPASTPCENGEMLAAPSAPAANGDVDVAMTPDLDEVGAVFRWLRKTQAMTQTELAEQAQVPRSNVTNIENGRKQSSWRTFRRLSAALGTTIGAVLEEAEQVTMFGPARLGSSPHHPPRPYRRSSAPSASIVDLGPVLRERREAAGLSLADVAARMRVDRAFVSHAEEGKTHISWSTVTKFADALEIRVGSIVLNAERKARHDELLAQLGDFSHMLGATLRAVRLERQLTITAVAAAAGVTRKTIMERESGITSPKLPGFYAMASALGYSGSDLVKRAEAGKDAEA